MSAIDIVPTDLAIMAMRDNGYRNAAYAVAELMDNSIQAGADTVQLLCLDKERFVNNRSRTNLEEVAVLDNGIGMDAETLQIALQFGNGSRLDADKWDGMGRFGMGLPSASISQCRRVDVWSWQEGPEAALHSYIDLDEIQSGTMKGLAPPERQAVPTSWVAAAEADSVGKTGTLVVWSKIDRCLWRTSNKLVEHSEFLIGRMYRKWISDGSVRIVLAQMRDDQPDGRQSRDAVANDPIYRMTNTSCPAPFEGRAMFEPFPEEGSFEIQMEIEFQGERHPVTIRFTIATESARKGRNPGAEAHGKHAAQNVGVSIVRAGRELDLDRGWTNPSDPRERWWGVEVCFEPGLDELFGVSNNKQTARNFSEAAKIDIDALAKEYGSATAAKAALEEEGDALAPLMDVIQRIQTNIRQMRQQLRVQGARNERKRYGTSSEEQATKRVRERQEEGHKGLSDEAESLSSEERAEDLKQGLVEQGHDAADAEKLAAKTINDGLKYRIEPGPLEGAFFSVQQRGGVLLVTLNTNHPAYELLSGAQDPGALPDNPESLREQLIASRSGLEMMLFAWARYEDEQLDSERRRQAQNVRFDWGRMAEVFLEAGSSRSD